MMGLPLEQMARVLQTATDEADIARIEGLFGVTISRSELPDISDPSRRRSSIPMKIPCRAAGVAEAQREIPQSLSGAFWRSRAAHGLSTISRIRRSTIG